MKRSGEEENLTQSTENERRQPASYSATEKKIEAASAENGEINVKYGYRAAKSGEKPGG